MDSLFEKLSKKFLIITKGNEFEPTVEPTEKSLVMPYCCCKDKRWDYYLDAENVELKNKNGEIKSSFTTTPLTKTVVEEKRKGNKVVERKEVEKQIGIQTYTPMIRLSSAEITCDLRYRSLLLALERGILDYFTEIIVDECEGLPRFDGQELPRTYAEAPEELKFMIEKRARRFIDKFDAFEIVERKNPIFGGLEEDDYVPYVSNVIRFYKLNENDKRRANAQVKRVMAENNKKQKIAQEKS